MRGQQHDADEKKTNLDGVIKRKVFSSDAWVYMHDPHGKKRNVNIVVMDNSCKMVFCDIGVVDPQSREGHMDNFLEYKQY